MSEMEVKNPDRIDWQRITDNATVNPDLPEAAPARLRRLMLTAIQSGALAPGTRLKEVELVEALSFLKERTTLRQAQGERKGGKRSTPFTSPPESRTALANICR